MRLALPLLVFALVVLVAYTPSPLTSSTAIASEAHTDWENLQVLPDSLSQGELRAIMDGFTEALGVQCSFCHVWTEGGPDFPADAKSQKEAARGMILMTWQINDEILPTIDGIGHHGPPTVTCDTCHRGSPMPTMEMHHEDGEGHDHDG
ncbi:MAG: c-type cytochrome [Bacteroidota bacterium]